MTSKRPSFNKFRGAGLNFDIPATLLPPDVFTGGNNVESFDVGMRSIRGHVPAFGTPIFPPEHLVYNKKADTFLWMYASGDGIGATDGQNHGDITPVPGPTSSWPDVNWTEAFLNGLVTLNNGIDPTPWYWDNSLASPMVALPDWPVGAICQSLRAYKYFLFAMDVSGFPPADENYLMWSDSADPGSIPEGGSAWTPLPENSAGFNTLSDTIGAIVDGIQFRDSFLILKENSTFICDFVGGNFVFAFRKVFTTSGILSANCAAEYLGNVAILTSDDFIMTDGQQADSLIDKRMRSWLFKNIDSDNYKTSFVTAFHDENQVWCCFPMNGSDEPNAALVWDATDNNFSIRDLVPKTPHIARGQTGSVTGIQNWDDDPQVWNEDVTVWDQALFNPTEDALLQADRNAPALYAVNEGNDWSGVPIPAQLVRTGLDFGDPHKLKLVKGIIPRIIGQAGTLVQIRVGFSPNDSDVMTWTTPQDFVIGSPQIISVFVTGRFIGFDVSSDSEGGAPWLLLGVDFQFDWQGLY